MESDAKLTLTETSRHGLNMDNRSNERMLVFGAKGAIGAHVAAYFRAKGWEVTGTTRSSESITGMQHLLPVDPFSENWSGKVLDQHGPFSAAVWAQGSNLNDRIQDVDINAHMELYRANCLFVISTLKTLLPSLSS